MGYAGLEQPRLSWCLDQSWKGVASIFLHEILKLQSVTKSLHSLRRKIREAISFVLISILGTSASGVPRSEILSLAAGWIVFQHRGEVKVIH